MKITKKPARFIGAGFFYLPSGGTFSGSNVSNGFFNAATAGVGTHTIFYSVSNEAGCRNSASQTITVKPAFNCPADRTIALGTDCKLTIPNLVSEVVVDGSCISSAIVSQSPSAGAKFSKAHNQTQVVTFSIYDASTEKTLSCSVTLTAKDITPPIVSCPTSLVNTQMTTACKITIPNIATATTTSDCSTVVKTQSPAAGSIYSTVHNQQFTVVITATDAAGNKTTCTRTVKAIDATKPTITTCPPKRNITLDLNCKLLVPNLTTELAATDCSGPLVVSQNPSAGSLLSSTNNQVHSVTMSATDAAGNTSTCSVSLKGIGVGCLEEGGGGSNLSGYSSNEINPTANLSDKKVYEKLLDLQASPNPFSDELTIAFDLETESRTRLVLTDLTGRFLFFENENSRSAGRQKQIWNTEDLPEGIYLVGLKVENGGWVYRKVVLVR